MNKTLPPTITFPVLVRSDKAMPQDSIAPHHILVLTPANFDYTSVTQRVCELAKKTGSAVHLLGLSNDEEQELALRRDLITMSALIRGAGISVSVTVEIGTDWVDPVKRVYRSGDMLVCMAEQRTTLLRRPLSQILESTLRAPIYILSELPPSRTQPKSSRASQALAWSGSLAIIIGFLILQTNIHQAANHWTTVMELLSTAIEFWLILAWNNLYG